MDPSLTIKYKQKNWKTLKEEIAKKKKKKNKSGRKIK